MFWGSEHGNATQYAVLASALRRGMQQANLSSTILVGPAVSGFGSQETWNYLQQLEAAGTLALFDAISVHAYRVGPPESVLADYARLSQMRGVKAMVSGEWGWSTCTPSQAPGTNCPPQARADEATAAAYLARSWLTNTAASVAVSVYYDYVDDCSDQTNRECRFGTVRQSYVSPALPHEPKPAFAAAVTLQRLLGKQRCTGRVVTEGDDTASSFVLAFAKNEASGDTRYRSTSFAVWTNRSVPITVRFRYITESQTVWARGHSSSSPTCFQTVGMNGTELGRLCSTKDGLLSLAAATGAPLYLLPVVEH